MSQSLFTSQIPAQNNQNDGTPTITRGMEIEFSASGNVSGIRWWCPVTNTGTYTVGLWDMSSNTTGTLLGSQVHVGTPVANDWNVTTLSASISVNTSKTYRIGVNNSEGRYVATPSFFGTPLTNGNLTAPADGSTSKGGFTTNNGSFNISGGFALPTSNAGPTNYFVDVVFDPATGTVDLAANFTATGSMTETLTREVPVTAALTATASMSATLSREVPLSAPLTATGSMTAALTREARLSAALTATGSMSATLNADIGMSAALSASASMSATLTVPTVGPVDPIGMPVAEELLACFTEQLSELTSPPKYIQLRLGQDTGPLIGANVDECCAGLAWVRISSIYPSWDSFPAPDNTWLPCGPLAYAVVLEMGVAFCMPWSDSDDSFDNIDPPSTQDWATAAATQMVHQTLMRRTAACCFRPTQRRAVGEWAPLPVEGGCTGGKLTVTVSVMAPCGDC